jgi:hypothetical protein
VSISGNINHPCLERFSAQAIKIPNTHTAWTAPAA